MLGFENGNIKSDADFKENRRKELMSELFNYFDLG